MTGVNLTTVAAKVMAEEAILDLRNAREAALANIDKEEKEALANFRWWHLFWLGTSLLSIDSKFEKRRKWVRKQSAHQFLLPQSIIAAVEHSASDYLYMAAEDIANLTIYAKE
jgi:hypothetical protein